MKRLPLIPTLIVGLAIAAMIALGVWQLQRAGEKEALLALYRANLDKPTMTFPRGAPIPDAAMFRQSSVMCLEVAGWTTHGGRAADGTTGYRHIARCRTGAEGPGALVDMGVARDPTVKPTWSGGQVAGVITTEPDSTSLIGKLAGRSPPLAPMLVATEPAPGLQASAPPSPENVPNNHLAYAGQWFFFALAAGVIYFLALRRRAR
ncbi:SURF1 family protein [Sphingomonas gilva]|uniref:SURF1-like protein n=1 Tax=Sphingomonas gilva TaxID=2305907 RepID=A0A396RR24_9SPHN|nr:SURF1 family protein [Sphingomonas gilva]RHW18436.1 SURF1 family protein [Sphingomonas gilva]